jgi:predicted PurR-regulated permease PerM
VTDLPPAEPPLVDRRRPDWRLALTVAVGVGGGLLLAGLVQGMLVRLRELLITLMVALFVSFALEPAVHWLHQRGVRRGIGTWLVLLAGLALFGGFIAAMAPLVVDQARMLVQQGPSLLTNLAEQSRTLLPDDLGEMVAVWLEQQRTELPRRLPELAPRIAGGALGFGATLLGTILQLLTAALVSFYLAADGPKLRRTLSSRLSPASQREFLELWNLAIAKTGSYLYSRLLTAVVSAIFHIVVFTIIGLPLRDRAGGVGRDHLVGDPGDRHLPGGCAADRHRAGPGPRRCHLGTGGGGHLPADRELPRGPRITAETMSLHPAVAFVSVLTGGALLGPVGALLALPVTAIVAGLFTAYGERHEVMEHGLTSQPPVRERRPRDHPRPERPRRGTAFGYPGGKITPGDDHPADAGDGQSDLPDTPADTPPDQEPR